jgi:hypothetical protein
VLAALSVAGSARAGTLQIRDETQALSPQDVSRLRSVLAEEPFDGRLVITTSYPDRQELSRYVGSLVSEPNMIVVGVDPQHHHVQVHFGTGSRIPPSAWPAIERAGNDAFRRGDWAGGAAAVFRDAAGAVTGAPESATRPGTRAPSLVGPGVLLLVLGGVVGLGLLVAFLVRRRGDGAYPGAGTGPGGYGPPPYGQPPYGGGYPYGAPPQGGMGPLGGGLIGAGLGGLAGYELGKLEGERERERDEGYGGRGEREDDRGGGFDAGGGNDDAGGGGSDWDDGGGGGFDGGDGGGFDGGGGDSGGGGSDF